MADAKKIVEGLNILQKYGLTVEVDAQHDVIYAGPGINGELTVEEQAEMEKIGWHWDEEFDCWAIFT